MSGKKQQQRRIREEKQAAARRRDKLFSAGWKVAAVILVPLVLVVLYQGLRNSAEVAGPAEIGAGDHVRGAGDAPVTLTVYADFQCPACREEAQNLARAWPRISDQARVVFRHFPLDTHRHSFLAARYAEAAGRQESFWEFHDLLYGNQQLWSSTASAAELFDTYAEGLGLDLEQLHADIEDPALRDKILADQRGGIRAGVRSTPSLFVNGRPVSTPRSATEFVNLVRRASGEERNGDAE